MVEENTGTIDYGIDLGTTTSSIAKVDGDTTIVVPNKTDNKNFVASAVYIKKNGTIFVGDKAKNKIATDPKNGFAEFKLRMGSDHVYEFEKSGMRMTPVQLSAEILKNLRATVKQMYQKDLRAAVITVPADFTAPQTQATTEAAELAGFKEVILLQEPTAAAMAYGFGNSTDNELWLIYDLGGGTFDVSIMKKTEDEIVNVNNQGDAYLGGKLIDWDIVDKVFVPALNDELGLTDFNRDNEKYLKHFAKLKKAAEIAKTDLSTYDTAEVEIENFFISDDGDVFDFEYDMTRQELDEIMRPYVDRTINHCHTALEDENLSISDVTKIILVGGSTLSPYIHERLTEEFNIPLEYSIDPTTVVARGAAIYAGTKLMHVTDEEPDEGFVSVELMYETLGDDIEFNVSGKIINPQGSSQGYSIEFVNSVTGYSSGRIPVAENGFFTTQLLAENENDYNIYQIKIYDSSGNIANLSPNCVNSIKYKIDIIPDRPKLSHTIGLGKFGNELDVIAEKSTELPFHFRKTYKSSNPVHRGNASDEVYIPLYQGNMIKADRNTLIGHLKITGNDVKRDLPADSEIELSVTINESMNIESSVYIEYLDQEFDEGMVITSEKKSRDVLIERFEEHKSRYNKILTESAVTTNMQIQNYLNQIISENMIDNIETFLRNSETDPDALDNASKRINEFANILDNIEIILNSLLSWDELKDETDQLIADIEANLDKAEPQTKVLYEQMKGMYDNAVETKNDQLLANVKDKMQFIFAQIHETELIMFTFLEFASSGEFIDQNAANDLIQRGNSALSNGNIDELRSIVSQLYKITKPSVFAQASDDVKEDPGMKDNRLR
ncbi:MAG: Hsp70 family protein [Methanobrevibacter sp.]|nr:Hsp70 family protein [Methanobrevibacter sp.]